MKTTKEDFEKAIKGSVSYNVYGSKKMSEACYELAKQMQPKWIPVSERLPKDGTFCIASYYNPQDPLKRAYVVPFWRGRGRWTLDNSDKEAAEDSTCKVTHWQPLPEPPTI